VGAQPYEAFAAIVRDELDRARSMMRTGIGRADLYARLMRDARDAPPPVSSPPSAPPVQRRVPVGGSPQMGPDDALVTLVLFSDFQCPFCARIEPALAQLRDRYGNDLRIVWKHNPLDFHVNAMPAAEATAEAFAQGGNSMFWALHDRLFANAPNLERAEIDRAAGEIGLDMGRFMAALDAHSHRDAIERDRSLAQAVGAVGTPTAFVNGWMIRGAQPIEAFQTLIDRELAAARSRVSQGTPRYRVYEAILADTPPADPAAAPAP